MTTHAVIECYSAARSSNLWHSTRILVISFFHSLFLQFNALQTLFKFNFHQNSTLMHIFFFVVFRSCAFANLMTDSTQTHGHTHTQTQSHTHTVTEKQIHNRATKTNFRTYTKLSYLLRLKLRFKVFLVCDLLLIHARMQDTIFANCFYFVLYDLLRAHGPARRSSSTTFSKHVEFVSDTCIKCRRRCCHDYFQSLIRTPHSLTQAQRCATLSLSLAVDSVFITFFYALHTNAMRFVNDLN